MTPDRWLTGAAILVITLLSFFWFPGHTILQSDTQIYLPILEHLRDPAILAEDPMASRPHVTYTIYDEIARLLASATGLSFETVLLIQHFLYRGAGVLGLYLIAISMELAPAAALLVAAVGSLGAYVVGPAVLTVEYEPVPRAFALPFILLSLGLAGHGRWTGATVAASVAFLFHPPTAAAYCVLLAATEFRRHKERALIVFAAYAALFLLVILVEPRPPDGQHLFSRIDGLLEQIQKSRANYNWVEVWIGRWLGQYLFLWAFGAAALWRIRRSVPGALRFFLAALPLCGLLSLPVSYLLLEQAKWNLIPQFQPGRYLLFVTLFAAVLGTAAGAYAAQRRRILEALLWMLVPLAIPLHPALFEWSAQRAWVTVILALSAAAALALTTEGRARRWAAATVFAAALLPFALVPAYGDPMHYPEASDGLSELASWARASTSRGAVFQFADAGRSLDPGIFRARSLRAVYVDWKSGGQVNYLPAFGRLWWNRWSQVKKPQTIPYYGALGIDYVVFTRARAPAGATPIYENATYAVFKAR